MNKSKVYISKNLNYIMNVASITLIALLNLAFLTHFALRQIYGAFQIYMLREATMIGTAFLILFALNTLGNSTSRYDTNRFSDALARLACAMFAVSFVMCAISSISFQITLPLFPAMNLGWLFGFAGASILILVFRSPNPAIVNPLLGVGVLILGFVLVDGIHQGLVTVGTITWNVLSDFEFAKLVTILIFYYLIELISDNALAQTKNSNSVFVQFVRPSLSVAVIFTLAMGINLESVIIICISFILIMSSPFIFIPLLPKRQARLAFSWSENLVRYGVAWCAVACTVAVVLRGLGHMGEAAAIGSFVLAVVGISRRWMTPRDLLTVLGGATRSMLALGLAFIAAALWNLLANSHTNLEAFLQILGIPGGAIFPVARPPPKN